MTKSLIKTLILITITISIINTALAQDQKAPYQLIFNGDGTASIIGDTGDTYFSYTTFTIFLNNNTNDTLYYQGYQGMEGDNLHFDLKNNLLFDLKSNPYFHLADSVYKNTNYSKIALPPHRSQKMQLFLTLDKKPDRNIFLHLSMKLYKWTDDNNKQQEKDKLTGQLSDTIELHYNSRHQQYWPIGREDKKETNILPNKDIYLLTDSDRKLYTLKIEQSKISTLRDTAFRVFGVKKMKRTKVVTVPVTLHNNSADTLRFYSMSCSWWDFWDTDSHYIRLPEWGDCLANFPTIETVAPHQQYTKSLDLIYDANVKTGSRYRISLSILKAQEVDKRFRPFWPGEYTRFNKIWSNEVTIQ